MAEPLECPVPFQRSDDGHESRKVRPDAGWTRVFAQAGSETLSRLRPLARRRLRILRPPGLFMRARNPCVLARLRRFGWYVRFKVLSLRLSFRSLRCAAHVWLHSMGALRR